MFKIDTESLVDGQSFWYMRQDQKFLGVHGRRRFVLGLVVARVHEMNVYPFILEYKIFQNQHKLYFACLINKYKLTFIKIAWFIYLYYSLALWNPSIYLMYLYSVTQQYDPSFILQPWKWHIKLQLSSELNCFQKRCII